MKEIDIKGFRNYYYADLSSLGLCGYYNIDLGFSGSNVVEEVVPVYYGFTIDFTKSLHAFTLTDYIRNIFIPE